MGRPSYWGSEEDAKIIGKALLTYLAKNPSCWNKIQHNTGYSDHEIADGMAWVRNHYGEMIIHRDDEQMPDYAPKEVRDLYYINENAINQLENKIEEMVGFLRL